MGEKFMTSKKPDGLLAIFISMVKYSILAFIVLAIISIFFGIRFMEITQGQQEYFDAANNGSMNITPAFFFTALISIIFGLAISTYGRTQTNYYEIMDGAVIFSKGREKISVDEILDASIIPYSLRKTVEEDVARKYKLNPSLGYKTSLVLRDALLRSRRYKTTNSQDKFVKDDALLEVYKFADLSLSEGQKLVLLRVGNPEGNKGNKMYILNPKDTQKFVETINELKTDITG